MRLRGVVLLAALALVFVSCGAGAPDASGPSEGIQVHGDWTIGIYNEDGSLDRSLEFSNALMSTGAAQLAQVMSGSASTGGWAIEVLGTLSSPPCPSSGVAGVCVADSVEVTWTGGEGYLTLRGATEVEADAEIWTVATRLGTCPASIAPTDCPNSGGSFEFTHHDLGEIVPVQAGQIAEITVEISFTSG